MGDTVWLYPPAVSKGRAPKFHRPWKGPYRVVKFLSDVTYRIQLVSPRKQHDRRSHHRLVVHFNRLKPCHLQENHQEARLDQVSLAQKKRQAHATPEETATRCEPTERVRGYEESNGLFVQRDPGERSVC